MEKKKKQHHPVIDSNTESSHDVRMLKIAGNWEISSIHLLIFQEVNWRPVNEPFYRIL